MLEILSAKHLVADLTLGLGTVVHDYLRLRRSAMRALRQAGSQHMTSRGRECRTTTSSRWVLQGGAARSAPIRPASIRACTEAGIRPNWLAGISIGALNAAVIAGSPEDERVERLREFLGNDLRPCRSIGRRARTIGSAPCPSPSPSVRCRTSRGDAGAVRIGQNGFFKPRFPPPFLLAVLRRSGDQLL